MFLSETIIHVLFNHGTYKLELLKKLHYRARKIHICDAVMYSNDSK